MAKVLILPLGWDQVISGAYTKSIAESSSHQVVNFHYIIFITTGIQKYKYSIRYFPMLHKLKQVANTIFFYLTQIWIHNRSFGFQYTYKHVVLNSLTQIGCHLAKHAFDVFWYAKHWILVSLQLSICRSNIWGKFLSVSEADLILKCWLLTLLHLFTPFIF